MYSRIDVQTPTVISYFSSSSGGRDRRLEGKVHIRIENMYSTVEGKTSKVISHILRAGKNVSILSLLTTEINKKRE